MARHVGPLRRWVSGRLPRWARDLADTDDLVQDTLLRTFKKMEGFEARGVGALQAYLRQAVMNRLRDELRRKGRAPAMVDLDEVRARGGRLAARGGDRTRSRRALRSGARAADAGGARSRSSPASRWTTPTRSSPRCSASQRRTRRARRRSGRSLRLAEEMKP